MQFGLAVTVAASVVRRLAAAEAGGAAVAQCKLQRPTRGCFIQKLVFGAAVGRRHLVPLRLCEKHLKAVYWGCWGFENIGMEDSTEAAEADGWLSILIASSAPSIAQWADIVQNLLCHTNAAKGLFFIERKMKGFFL